MSSDADVSYRRLLGYGGPIIGIGFLLFFVQFYFLKFATDVLLLPPATVGALFAVAKLWDAISNPIVGSWSDRTQSRYGRRRPFLVGALPLMAGGYILLWSPPQSLTGGLLVAWEGLGLLLFFTAYALYAIPHAALGAEMSSDSHQRTRLFGAKQISFILGMLLAFGAIQLAMNAEGPREMTALIAVPGAFAAIALLLITPLTIAEPAGERRGGQSMVSGLRDVFANQPARLLVLVWFIESAGAGSVGTMAPYVAEYLLRRPELVGSLPAAYVLAGVVSIPLWVNLSRRFGRRDTWIASMLMAATSFGAMMFVGAEDFWLLLAMLVVAGIAMGCGTVLASSLMADIIDLDESSTGERKDGVYSAAMMFALKLGSALSTVASGFILGAAGFVPNAVQSETSLWGIRLLFGGLPCVGFLLGAALFRRFPLGGRNPGGA